MINSTLQHLRYPFSIFLLPIFLSALAATSIVDSRQAIISFLIIHLLLYPASNGFNSYFDRDTGPIGALEHPPPVNPSLLTISLLLDLLALIAGYYLVGRLFALGLLIYGSASKLYSWDKTRLKARPLEGWLMTGFGQGGLTFVLVIATVDSRGLTALDARTLANALAVTLLLLGIFPLTQVYQHEADAARGDLTISRLVGIGGTFVLSGICLGLGIASLGYFIYLQSGFTWTLIYALTQAPSALIFLGWFRRVLHDPIAASFKEAMRMNLMASGLLNAFYLAYLAIVRSDHFH